MFYNCCSLIEIDISNFVTSQIGANNQVSANNAYYGMFYGCENLEHIYIGSGWVFQTKEAGAMFMSDTKLPNYTSKPTKDDDGIYIGGPYGTKYNACDISQGGYMELKN